MDTILCGRGNIRESQLHGRRVSEQVIEEFLAWQPEDYEEIFERAIDNADRKVEKLSIRIKTQPMLSKEKTEKILERVSALQKKVNYDGVYERWISKNLPSRIENLDKGDDL